MGRTSPGRTRWPPGAKRHLVPAKSNLKPQTSNLEDAFSRLKERLLGQLGLFMVDPDKGFVLRTDASDYAVGAVLEQVRDDGSHVPVAFWSRILAEGQRRTWTAREKETYAIVCALRKWSGHIGLQPLVVCTDHQSLQSWHKEHADGPLGRAARRARWHETFAKFDVSVVYVPGKDNTVADCLSRCAYPAGKAPMDICSHGDAKETEEAKRIIEMEKAMEQEGVKCFVVMANRTDLAKFRGARVQAFREETHEQWMVAPVELVRSVLTEDWSDDYAASDHWSRYWNAVSAPSDDEWPEGLTEDGDELFLKDKLLVPENRMEELIDHWHNAQLMHPGRDKMQQDLESRFKFRPGYYAILDKYCSDCAVCRATKSPNHSTAGSPVYTGIPEAPMRSVAMVVFAMPEVTVEGETYDCVILAVERHSGYIVAVPGKKSKKKDKKDKHGVGLQAKTVVNAMIRHWLTIFDVPAVICSDRGSQFVGRGSRRCAGTWGFGTPRPWRTTAGRMAGQRWPGGRCSKGSASCTLTNQAGIGTIRCGEYFRRTTTFRGPLDCRPIVSCSYRIGCHTLSRG